MIILNILIYIHSVYVYIIIFVQFHIDLKKNWINLLYNIDIPLFSKYIFYIFIYIKYFMITNSFTIIYTGHNIANQYTGDTEKLEWMILI